MIAESDRKLFYSGPPSNPGMKEGTNGTENRIRQLKDKLDLDDMVGDMGISAPSMDLNEYIRVLKLARKPDREEFTMIAKVSIAGIALIGMMGFLIYVLLTQLPRAL
jgi:protein transport protein SEC61 subunit gamma-like protein